MAENAVVVVHGVGDPQPGDALSGFVNAYCAVTGVKVERAMLIERRQDMSHPDVHDDGLVPLFPVSQLTAQRGGTSPDRALPFFEVYWGDLSRVKGSFLGLVEATVDLVFGLRHVVFAAQRELAAAGETTKHSLLPKAVSISSTAALWLSRGPVLALNILAAVASLLFVALGWVPRDVLTGIDRSLTAVCVAAFLTSALGAVLYITAKRARWSTTTAESMFLVGAMAFFLSVWIAPDRYRTIDTIAQDLTLGLSVFAGLLALFVLLMLITSLLLAIALDDRIRFDEMSRRAGHRALLVVNVCTTLSCALFVFLIMLVWAVATEQVQGVESEELRKRIAGGLHLFALVWVTFLSMGVAYALLMLRSYWLKRKSPLAAGTRFPRYIVHPAVVAVLIGSGIAWPSLFLPLVYQLECKHFVDKDVIEKNDSNCTKLTDSVLYKSTVAAIEKLNPFGILLSTALLPLLLAGRAHLGTALDIVLDVISHFRRKERSAPQILKTLPRRLAKMPRTEGSDWVPLFMQEPSEWETMVGRFRDVVELAISRTQCRTLTVIAHSQGTMIALEALGVISIHRTDMDSTARRFTQGGDAACTVHLVTMGCPLADLYLHYFPAKYTINPRGESAVTSWRNIHRADDFVGTSVANLADASFPANTVVGARGHVNYWLDREVLEALKPVLETM